MAGSAMSGALSAEERCPDYQSSPGATGAICAGGGGAGCWYQPGGSCGFPLYGADGAEHIRPHFMRANFAAGQLGKLQAVLCRDLLPLTNSSAAYVAARMG